MPRIDGQTGAEEEKGNMTRTRQWMAWAGLAAVAAGCGRQEAQVVEARPPAAAEVAVWVDNAGLTQGQIQRLAARMFARVPPETPPEQMAEIKSRILQQAVETLIMRQLVQAEMERSGVLISQVELEAAKDDLEAGLGDENSLALLLAETHLTAAELEASLRLDVFQAKVLKESLAAAEAEVTPAAVRAYYDGHPEEFTLPAGRTASHVLVRIPADGGENARAEARARADKIRKAALQGADFAELARKFSECESRERGGELGLLVRDRMPPEMVATVDALGVGEISEVFESPRGFHVLRVTGELAERVEPFAEIQDRLEARLRDRARQRVTLDYLAGLREKATIKLVGALAEAVKTESPAP
jgi:peptidyl-prolyl cis-trans isomerase C